MENQKKKFQHTGKLNIQVIVRTSRICIPNIKSYFAGYFGRHQIFLVPVKKTELPSRMTSFPRIFLSNTRSMVNKLENISATISINRPDIVVITGLHPG